MVVPLEPNQLTGLIFDFFHAEKNFFIEAKTSISMIDIIMLSYL